MTQVHSPPVFTPDNEPYLGREMLFQFDNLICACLELNAKCAPASHGISRSEYQDAICMLAPQTITLALSIRELIRQGYLFGAKVLVRPLTERAVTMLYLMDNAEALRIWANGWKHNERPRLQEMVEHLNEALGDQKVESVRGFTHELNSATHGDPLSAKWNIVHRDDGAPVFPVSKNLASPGLVDEICLDVLPWLASTMGAMTAAFGDSPSVAGSKLL